MSYMSSLQPRREIEPAPPELAISNGLDPHFALHLDNRANRLILEFRELRLRALAVVELFTFFQQLDWPFERSNVIGAEWREQMQTHPCSFAVRISAFPQGSLLKEGVELVDRSPRLAFVHVPGPCINKYPRGYIANSSYFLRYMETEAW